MTGAFEFEFWELQTPEGTIVYEHRFVKLANGTRGVEWDADGHLNGTPIGDQALAEAIRAHGSGQRSSV